MEGNSEVVCDMSSRLVVAVRTTQFKNLLGLRLQNFAL